VSQETFTWLAIVEARDQLSEVYSHISRVIEEFDGVIKKASEDASIAGVEIDQGLKDASHGADDLHNSMDHVIESMEALAAVGEENFAITDELIVSNHELSAAIKDVRDALLEQTAALEVDNAALAENTREEKKNEDQQKKTKKAASDSNAEFKLMSTLLATMGPAAIPMLTGIAVAAGSVAFTLAGAAVAVGAFGLAFKSQLTNVTNASGAYDKYTAAVKDFGKNSKQAQAALKAYDDQVKGMPKATIQASQALTKFKDEFHSWSDALASSTMPVFIRALEIVEKILPLLSPLVKDVAHQLYTMFGALQGDMGTKKFQTLAKEFQDFSEKSLAKVIKGVEILVKDLVKVGESQGMKDFITAGKKDFPIVVNVLKNLAEFIGKFLKAAQGFGGLDLKAIEMLAQALNKIPQPLLNMLVPIILGVAAAMKIWTVAQIALNVAMDANPVMLIITAIAALVLAFIYLWNNCKGFRDFWINLWHDIQTIVGDVVDWLKGHWREIITIIGGPIGLVVALVTKYWSQIVAVIEGAVHVIRGIIDWFGQLGTDFHHWWDDAVNAIKIGVTAAIAWFQGLKDKVLKVLASAGSWLYGIGKNIIDGLWNGINAATGGLLSKIGGLGKTITGAFKSIWNILSPSRVMADEVGKYLPMGIAQGITENLRYITDAVKAAGAAGTIQAKTSFNTTALYSAIGGGGTLPTTGANAGGNTYLVVNNPTLMSDRDMQVFAEKLGGALGTTILPSGGLHLPM